MKIKDAARAALSGLPRAKAERGLALLEEIREGSFTARLDDGSGAVQTVVWEIGDEGSRAGCSCGDAECEHQAALLGALAGDEVTLASSAPSPPASAAAASTGASASGPSPAALASAIAAMVDAVCSYGLGGGVTARDDALSAVMDLLAETDSLDLKRAVATVRRSLTAAAPDVTTALPALLHLSRAAASLAAAGAGPGEAPQAMLSGAERREEVKLLEVARSSQRTPFGDRRDVSYFLDLDADVLYLELAASSPGSVPAALSEGPFPKRLLGNLATVDAGPSPRRIRLLQYSVAGFPSDADLDHLLACCTTEVSTLYAAVRDSHAIGEEVRDHLVLFAPEQVLAAPSGVVLCDRAGALLPLARGINPALCATVDLLARQGSLLAVAGHLVVGASFVALLPLTALVELGVSRSLRQLA